MIDLLNNIETLKCCALFFVLLTFLSNILSIIYSLTGKIRKIKLKGYSQATRTSENRYFKKVFSLACYPYKVSHIGIDILEILQDIEMIQPKIRIFKSKIEKDSYFLLNLQESQINLTSENAYISFANHSFYNDYYNDLLNIIEKKKKDRNKRENHTKTQFKLSGIYVYQIKFQMQIIKDPCYFFYIEYNIPNVKKKMENMILAMEYYKKTNKIIEKFAENNYLDLVMWRVEKLELRIKVLNEKHTDIARIYFNLSDVYLERIRYDESDNYIKRGELEIMLEILGGDVATIKFVLQQEMIKKEEIEKDNT